jgi:hypothetical protein
MLPRELGCGSGMTVLAPPARLAASGRVGLIQLNGTRSHSLDRLQRQQSQIDVASLSTYYLSVAGMNTRALDRELKRGSAELLVLSLLDARRRHGYELSNLIHARSGDQLTFHIDALYPLLSRLEERGWIRVRGQTSAAFVEAVRRVTGDQHA